MILIGCFTICSTSLLTRPSCWWAGIGYETTRVRTAGVDGQTAYYVQAVRGVEDFLDELRDQLRDRSFRPLPTRERLIPKANGKLRRLGISTVRDRVVQASLKLVLEPIFEADFLP
jgi:RNA-directed DNA polymerase